MPEIGLAHCFSRMLCVIVIYRSLSLLPGLTTSFGHITIALAAIEICLLATAQGPGVAAPHVHAENSLQPWDIASVQRKLSQFGVLTSMYIINELLNLTTPNFVSHAFCGAIFFESKDSSEHCTYLN